VLILDFSIPKPPLLWAYRPYLHHVLPRLAAFLTGEKAAYDYLGDSIEAFPHGRGMCELIAGAGLDVFSEEPKVPAGFYALDNAVLVPHVGSATHETRFAMGMLQVDNLRALYAGKPLLTPVV